MATPQQEMIEIQRASRAGTSFIPVEELTAIDRYTFLEDYRFRRPFILRGGATQLPMFKKWSLEYLEREIGHVQIRPLLYEQDPRDYSKAHFIEMSFREFCRELRADDSRTLYWIAGPVSNNVWAGPGKGAEVNRELHMLAADFSVPAFLRKSELIYGQIILGTGKNGTVVHYDFGGEAKCLVQLLGEKHVLLVPPQHGGALALPSITENKNFTISPLDVRGRNFTSRCRDVPVYEARIRPGDVLYWPSYWLHDVANAGAINLAINLPIDEIPVNPLMLRHLLAMNVRRLQQLDPDWELRSAGIRELEDELLTHTNISTLWQVHTMAMRSTEEKPDSVGDHMKLRAAKVYVKDLAEANRFYNEIVGLPLKAGGPEKGFCIFDTGPTQLILEPVPPSAPANLQALAGRVTGLSFSTEDIHRTYQDLLSRGVTFSSAPERQCWGGWLATVSDPFGNTFELVQE